MNKTVYTEKEAQEICAKYDITRALRSLAGDGNADAGFEAEIGADYAMKIGKVARGFAVPDCVLANALARSMRSERTGENYLIPTVTRTDWLGALMAKSVLGCAGVQTISGCVGDLKFPRGGDVTPYWIATDGAATNSNPAFTTGATATAHTVGCYTDISRKLMLQTSEEVHDYIFGMIAASVALGVEKAAFSGSGSYGEPTGLDNKVGVHAATITAGTPTRAEIVGMWAGVAADNADGAERFAFVAPSAVKAKLLTSGDGHGRYLYERGTLCDVAPLYDSNVATAKKIYAGDWSKMLICAWSGIDLTKDTATLDAQGAIRAVTMLDCDVAVLEPKAFSVGTVLV